MLGHRNWMFACLTEVISRNAGPVGRLPSNREILDREPGTVEPFQYNLRLRGTPSSPTA